MIIILDNGHGKNTPGKCSPDKSLLEYKWNREIAKMLHEALTEESIKSVILVPEEIDISLTKRIERANTIYRNNNKQAILISIHVNAAGNDGKWRTASGFSPWVASNASNNSKRLAKILQLKAEAMGLKGNRCVPKKKYWVGDFAIIRNTDCPAVLTENLFQDNKEDVEFLLSEVGKKRIVKLHLEAIKEYLKDL